MKPTNRLQQEIYSLSKELPQLTENQKEWAFFNCLNHNGRKTKSGITCLDCGIKFVQSKDTKKCICPNCGTSLDLVETTKQKFEQEAFLAVFTVCNGYQVNRYFEVKSYERVGVKNSKYLKEVVQHWFLPNGKYEVVARNRDYNWYSTRFHGDLEIKDKSKIELKYNIIPTKILPKSKFLPTLKRNGLTNKFFNISPFKLFKTLLTNNKAETLIKAKQYDLFTYISVGSPNKIDTYWSAIKACIRNGYIVKDASTWIDYVELLQFFNRDLTNPKYVCPTDLHKEHNRYVSKKTKYTFDLKVEELKEKMEVSQAEYYNTKKKYFGLFFTAGDITINVLQDVEAFLYEGLAHGHCVFSNEYYDKTDSLILSAKVKGVHAETIEVSLSDMEVKQSRGKGNKASTHNKEILALLNANLKFIRKAKDEKETLLNAA